MRQSSMVDCPDRVARRGPRDLGDRRTLDAAGRRVGPIIEAPARVHTSR